MTDSTGKMAYDAEKPLHLLNRKLSNLGMGVSGGAGIYVEVVALGIFIDLGARTIMKIYSSVSKEIYDFSQILRQQLAQQRKKMPHVHHIVPVGKFSKRSPETIAKIDELHNMLNDAEINRFVDPMNLMLVSSGTHSKLHTDAYISHVYDYIVSTDGSKEEIYLALFYLRLEIAAMDMFASGY